MLSVHLAVHLAAIAQEHKHAYGRDPTDFGQNENTMDKLNGAALAAGMTAMLLVSTPALAQRGQWGPGWGPGGGSGWGAGYDPMFDSPRLRSSTHDPREGRVEVSRFVAPGPEAQALGHGPVTVESESGDGPWVEASMRRTYEAAVIDGLVGVGYDTVHPDGPQAQVTKLRISRQVLTPAEEKKSPVSGTAAMEVGTRGTAYGLGINVDLTKPRSALVSTRLDARILDKASGKVLWEGYATIATREGDGDWSDGRIAMKLASALFDNFPKADPVERGPAG